MSAVSRTRRIAELNDALRSRAGLPVIAGNGRLKGLIVITRGIVELPFDTQAEILAKVRGFDGFNEDCDPHGEHDFGAFEIESVGRIFFKLDYYSDENLEYGSEDPSDPDKSFRVLTIMLAEEY